MFLNISGVAWGRLTGPSSRPNAPGQDPFIVMAIGPKTPTPLTGDPTRPWAKGPANLKEQMTYRQWLSSKSARRPEGVEKSQKKSLSIFRFLSQRNHVPRLGAWRHLMKIPLKKCAWRIWNRMVVLRKEKTLMKKTTPQDLLSRIVRQSEFSPDKGMEESLLRKENVNLH